jgi:antitoxin (DNA-binding transcriptional repressor) of toxin-antitoxin stability system
MVVLGEGDEIGMKGRTKVVEIESVAIDEVAARAEDGETVILARDGRPVAAVMAVAALQGLTEERELLRRLALGELESAGGEGEDLEAVLEDCRLLLEEN